MQPEKVVIYTAIYGKKDTLKEPSPEMARKYKFVCFTNDPELKSNLYDIKFIPGAYTNTRNAAKIYKILPHLFFPTYEYSIWIDANLIVEADIDELLKKYLKDNDWAMYKHQDGRDCAYDEADVCIRRKKDNVAHIKRQILMYEKEGFPRHFGLDYGGIIYRRHLSPEVVKMNHKWWDEIQKHSKRDQISLQYILWKNNYKIHKIQINPAEDKFITVGHNWDFTAPVDKGFNIEDRMV